MAKRKNNGTEDTKGSPSRKLEKALLKLSAARECYEAAVARGELEVEQARQRAAGRVAKAQKEIDRRERKVEEVRSAAGSSSPIEVAEHLEDLQSTLRPDLSTDLSPNGALALPPNAQRALEELRGRFGVEGTSPKEWRAALNMPETTFARARQTLIERGLVVRAGDVGREIRYALTDLGRSYGEDG